MQKFPSTLSSFSCRSKRDCQSVLKNASERVVGTWHCLTYDHRSSNRSELRGGAISDESELCAGHEMSQGAGAAGATTEFSDYQWAYSVMDSSRVSTCLISMLLIVYGSFRSLNMEQEQREREKKRQSDSMNSLLTGEPVQQEQSEFC